MRARCAPDSKSSRGLIGRTCTARSTSLTSLIIAAAQLPEKPKLLKSPTVLRESGSIEQGYTAHHRHLWSKSTQACPACEAHSICAGTHPDKRVHHDHARICGVGRILDGSAGIRHLHCTLQKAPAPASTDAAPCSLSAVRPHPSSSPLCARVPARGCSTVQTVRQTTKSFFDHFFLPRKLVKIRSVAHADAAILRASGWFVPRERRAPLALSRVYIRLTTRHDA